MIESSRSSLRQKILAFVGALVVVSLLGSTLSLYRITEVNRLLDVMNRVSVPLGRLFTQTQADADLYQREVERSIGSTHWKDTHWRARPVPRWINDVVESEVTRIDELISNDLDWAPIETRQHWRDWAGSIRSGFAQLKDDSAKVQFALEQGDQDSAARAYSHWETGLEAWKRQLQGGAAEYDRTFRQTFSLAERRVSELQTGLETILAVVILLSLLMLWLGERALRPLGELTRLAREITRRGLKKEDKALLPEIPLSRKDEVSQLAREFHRMATALLEREKTVEAQKHRLQEQNSQLRVMGELNENVLQSIDSILIATDLDLSITQLNPVAQRWIGAPAEQVKGVKLTRIPKVARLLEIHPEAAAWLAGLSGTSNRDSRLSMRPASNQPEMIDGRIYGGHLMPLRSVEHGEESSVRGAILVLEDLTQELDLQERLQRAENLAAIGRMSAQVAHEVRNPLHSIGLEAEMAAELAARIGHPAIKQSLQSILSSVDRLEKITDNYLKLSRLSTGEKSAVDFGDVLESVLATYAPVCESQGIRVDWRREPRSLLKVWGDRDLLEQVLGNLFRNALQALEPAEYRGTTIRWAMGNTDSSKVWIRIEDNGPGIPEDVLSRLFVPFVTSRAQGTGLGLSFVKKVVEDHGGAVEYRPVRPSGSCFEITVPQWGAEQRVPAPEVMA